MPTTSNHRPHEPLTDAEVLSALHAAKEGTRAHGRLRDELARRILRAVTSLARQRLGSCWMRIAPSYQEAVDEVTCRTMLHAQGILASWDPARASLRTRSDLWVRGAIGDAIRDARTIPLPERIAVQAGRLDVERRRRDEARSRLLRHGIADSTTESALDRLHDAEREADRFATMVTASECCAFDDLAPSHEPADPSDATATTHRILLRELATHLDDVDRSIVHLWAEGWTFREIGAQHGVSHTRAIQRFDRALETMRARGAA